MCFAASYIYLAVTTSGLSPYERGKLVGKALFNVVLGFAGVEFDWGELLNVANWVPEAGEFVRAMGSLGRAIELVRALGGTGRERPNTTRLSQSTDRNGDGAVTIAWRGAVGRVVGSRREIAIAFSFSSAFAG